MALAPPRRVVELVILCSRLAFAVSGRSIFELICVYAVSTARLRMANKSGWTYFPSHLALSGYHLLHRSSSSLVLAWLLAILLCDCSLMDGRLCFKDC